MLLEFFFKRNVASILNGPQPQGNAPEAAASSLCVHTVQCQRNGAEE